MSGFFFSSLAMGMIEMWGVVILAFVATGDDGDEGWWLSWWWLPSASSSTIPSASYTLAKLSTLKYFFRFLLTFFSSLFLFFSNWTMSFFVTILPSLTFSPSPPSTSKKCTAHHGLRGHSLLTHLQEQRYWLNVLEEDNNVPQLCEKSAEEKNGRRRERGSDPIWSRNGGKTGKGAVVIGNSKLRRTSVIAKRKKVKWCGIPIMIVLVEEMQ